MDGEGGKKGVRRPMNAFLIFCKRHRSKVREKNPEMDNRSITRVLGDLWAKLGGEEKANFKNLEKQYKDAFMKANPDYKWHASDKVHRGATSKSQNMASSSKHMQDIPVNSEITPGKLADPGQMGGLNLLLKAGKESSSTLPSKPKQLSASSSLFSCTPVSIPAQPLPIYSNSSFSSASSFSSPQKPFPSDSSMPPQSTQQSCPISTSDVTPGLESSTANSALLQLAEMCTTELYSSSSDSKGSSASPSQVAVAPPKKRAKHWNKSPPSAQPLHDENGRRQSFNTSSSTVVRHEKTNDIDHNVPLDLSQSQTQQTKKSRKKQKVAAEEVKQSMQSWRKRKRSSSATDSVSSHSISPVNSGDVFSESLPSAKLPVDYESNRLSGEVTTSSRSEFASLSTYQQIVGGMNTDNSNTSANTTNIHHEFLTVDEKRKDFSTPGCFDPHNELVYKSLSSEASFLCASDKMSISSVNVSLDAPFNPHLAEGKIASLLRAAPAPPVSELGNPSYSQSHAYNERDMKPFGNNQSSLPASTASQAQKRVNLDESSLPAACSKVQPFTQGKVKKKWAQRMMVEAKQEEELALEKSGARLSNQLYQADRVVAGSDSGTSYPLQRSQVKVEEHFSNHPNIIAASMKTEPHATSPGGRVSSDGPAGHGGQELSMAWTNGSCNQPRHPWGVHESRNPLPPPPPISTSLPTSDPKHVNNTLYKALTSEISPPRHVGPKLQSVPPQDQKVFKPIAACGKKIVDHIVEQLIRPDFSKDKKETQSQPLFGLFSGPFSGNCELQEGKSHSDKSRLQLKETGKGLWSTAPPAPNGDHSRPGWMKNEDDQFFNSYTASSLVEKVVRKVCGPQTVGGDVHSSDSKVFPCSGGLYGSGGSGLAAPHGVRLMKIEKMETFSDLAKSRENVMIQSEQMDNPTNPDIGEDQTLVPVRKSRRANRGQKYQALIKEGIIQPAKERLAARNGARIVRSFSGKEEGEQAELLSSRSYSDSNGTREDKSASGVFDLEKEIASLPLCSLARVEKKKMRGRSDSDAARVSSDVKKNVTAPLPVSKREGAITVPEDTQKSATYHLTASESGCRTVHIPLPKEEWLAEGLTGSRKRKARRHRITRLSVFDSDDKTKGLPVSDRDLSSLPPAVKELIASSVSVMSDKPMVSSSIPAFQRKVVSSNPTGSVRREEMADSSRFADSIVAKKSCTALNLLTSAAIESERAVFPAWSRSAQMNISPSSETSSDRQQIQVSKSSPLPAAAVARQVVSLDSATADTTLVCSKPASVPVEEAHVSNSHHPGSLMLQFRPSQHVASPPTTLITTAAYSSQLLQSLSSNFLPPGPYQNAPSSISSINVPFSNPKPVVTEIKSQPSPFIVSTLPTSSHFQQTALGSETKSRSHVALNAPNVRKKSMPLKIPIISSGGDGAGLKKEPSTHQMSEQLRREMDDNRNKEASIHNPKLVKLLLNKDVPSPLPSQVSSLDANNHKSGGKPREMMPGIHVKGETPQPKKRQRVKGSPKDGKKQSAYSGPAANMTTPVQSHNTMMKGLPSPAKFFPSPVAPLTAGLSDSGVKKRKPTIWDHLVPVKSIKTSKTPPSRHVLPSRQSLNSSVQSSPTLQVVSRQGSDTDSANEGIGPQPGPSDTDSADESEANVSNGSTTSSFTHPNTNAAPTVVSYGKPAVLSTTSQPKPSDIVEEPVRRFPPHTPKQPATNPHAIAVTAPLPPTTLPCGTNKNLVVASETASSLPPSFVGISSITLPSDIPDTDDILSPRESSTFAVNPQPSPKFIVKTIAPAWSYPSTHVTDLSSSASSPAVMPKMVPSSSGILLSTLQNPHSAPNQPPPHPLTSPFSFVHSTTSATKADINSAGMDGSSNRQNRYNTVMSTTALLDAEQTLPCNSPRLPGSPSVAVVQS